MLVDDIDRKANCPHCKKEITVYCQVTQDGGIRFIGVRDEE